MTAEQLCALIGADETEQYYIETGLHYGYPPCCVFWFATVWSRIYDLGEWECDDCDDLTTEARELYMKYWDWWERVFEKADHVLCPACLLKSLTELTNPDRHELEAHKDCHEEDGTQTR